MRAYELQQYDAPLARVERPPPMPGPGEVRIRVEACGVCGSDLFLQEGGFGVPLPVIPGHEAAGTVDAVGASVHDWQVGDRAALYYISTPPGDPWAAAGTPNRSPFVVRMGVDTDGAFAEYVLRPPMSLVRAPSELPAPILAVLTDAVATPLHALRVSRATTRDTVVIIGVGGIGSAAILLAKALGARVVAVARSPWKQTLASDLGADEVVPLSDSTSTCVKEACGGVGADVVVQCVGAPEMDELAISVAAPGARIVLVGVAKQPMTVSSSTLIWRELEVLGSRGFTPGDIEQAIHLYATGSISVDHLVEDVRPLHEANTALDDLRRGRTVRPILIP